MEYIFPIPSWLRGKLLNYKRLYAFPVEPEDNPFILDSGAFGLSKSGKKMNEAYFESLHQYYIKYPGWHVAPDVFLNPFRTMRNFKKWIHKYPDCRVWPVIQFNAEMVEWKTIEYQLDFYLKYIPELDILFFSNPSLRACNYPKDIFQKIKDNYPVSWIHNLGAGWNIEDIRIYASLKGLDSIDSIAYYNAVNTVLGNWNSGKKGNKQEKAIANAEYVRQYL